MQVNLIELEKQIKEYKGVCEGLDMLIRHFEEVKNESKNT